MVLEVSAQTASRLMDALEKLGQSPGFGLQSGGPSGEPSQDLVKAFQEALNTSSAPQEAQAAASASPAEPGPATSMPSVERSGTPQAAGADSPRAVDGAGSAQAVDGLSPAQNVEKAPSGQGVDGMSSEAPGVERRGSEMSPGRNAERVGGAGSPEQTVERAGEATLSGQPDRAFSAQAGKGSRAGEDPLQELGRLLERVSQSGHSVTPQELYRVQYLVGVLKVQSQIGLNTSQTTAQGLESVLRQSG